MAEYKSNHYVQQLILRQFYNSDCKLAYFNSRNPLGNIELKTSSDVFCKDNFYVSLNSNEQRDVSLEKQHYGDLDSEFGKILNEIICKVESNNLIRFSDEQFVTLYRYLGNQLIRGRERLDVLTDPDNEKLIADKVKWLFGGNHRLNGADFKRILQSNLCKHLSSDIIDPLINTIAKSGIYIAKIDKESNQFIIGSNPCVLTSFSDIPFGIYMPLTPKLAIVSYGAQNESKVFSIPSDRVDEINSLMAMQSYEIAGASKELVEKYAEEMKARVKLQK